MSSDVKTVVTTAVAQYAHRSDRRILFLAIAGWCAMSVAVVAVTMFQNRSSEKTEPISATEQKLVMSHSSQQPAPRTQSCSTSNCHGAIQQDPHEHHIRSDEYFVWLEDPHSNAFRTLSNERSLKIFQNLGMADARGNSLPGREAPFERHLRNCRGCHDTNEHLAASTEAKTYSPSFAEGISCESCHGAASNWLHQHYRPEWRDSLNEQQKQHAGLIGAGNLSARIRQCATCHVGSSRGEVNHDLIAAGHPALRFEFVWYQSRLPRHWKPERHAALANRNPKQAATSEQTPTREWFVGQLVTSIASLEQLDRRISGQGFEQTLPELAEYNCFACHHDLQIPSWRRNRGLEGLTAHAGKRSRLVIPWGNWNLGLIPLLAEGSGSADSKACSAAFHRLRDALQQTTTPSRAELIELTRDTRHCLEEWLKTIDRLPSPVLEQFVHQLGQQQPEVLLADWDRTANFLLGIAASYRASNEYPDLLKKAMYSIRFPQTPQVTDSPTRFLDPDDPSSLTRAQWIELLEQISALPPVD